ncbi:MAG: bifunctional hydroxymethylpyrimidine kinase/phosphomethylpyrimidine kinase [Pseudomonadota bacterium]
MIRVLTIAGSDSGGGAGVQADLGTIAGLSGYGLSVITALTAQNTMGVQSIFETPLSVIEAQLDSVLTDIGADGVKTGMLVNEDVVRLTASKLKTHNIKHLVVDPVLNSESGRPLLSKAGLKALVRDLLPLADICVPNLAEAEALSGILIRTPNDMAEASRIILDSGARAVLVKGGHLHHQSMDVLLINNKSVDVLNTGKEIREFSADRVETVHTHGSGCVFSAALTTFLAQGFELVESVGRAKEFITAAIRGARPLGMGRGPVHHTALTEKMIVLQSLAEAARMLTESQAGDLAPEVRINLGFALSDPAGPEDVAAFPARIVKMGKNLFVPTGPIFGGSRHVAKIILTAQKADPTIRAVMNIRFASGYIDRARSMGMSLGEFNRRDEPPRVKEREGSSLEWGTTEVIAREGRVPDLIFDHGDLGKEPMIRILGRDPRDVVEKALRLQ